MTQSEFSLFKALRKLYPAAEYALLPQVANGTGSNAKRHADALALSLWPSRGLTLTGFEIKSYRGDWVRELRNPAKADVIQSYCHQWYIVAGGPFIETDELPPNWGLYAFNEKNGLVKVKTAPVVAPTRTPDLSFVAAILRKAQESVGPEAEIQEAKAEAYQNGLAAGKLDAERALKDYTRLQHAVSAFEKASGLTLNKYSNGRELGEAVKVVLNGTANYEKERLIETARRILRELVDEQTPQ